VPLDYKPPSRQDIGTKLLDANHKEVVEKQYEQLNLDKYIFSLTVFGVSCFVFNWNFICYIYVANHIVSLHITVQDDLTHQKTPFLNILCAGVHNHNALLEIVDCTDHCAEGNKKDAQYIADTMMPQIQTLDPTN